MDPISLYLHIPFCRHKCSYCDFNTYAGMDERIESYVEALRREIALFEMAAGSRIPIKTVFFGGGTPSVLKNIQIETILRTVRSHFDLKDGAEITLEANPGTLSQSYLKALRAAGVNRLSLGMQTSDPGELKLLERQHRHWDVLQAVASSRKAGFHNLNLDLIFGLPNQSLQGWQKSLRYALDVAPEHFSLYALTLENGTPLKSWVDRGLVGMPDPDLAAEMYDWASACLEEAGYEQYEISNWAKSGAGVDLRCQHNLQYWRNQPYIGLGAGAHGFIGGLRTSNVLSPQAYIERCANGHKRAFPRTPATTGLLRVDHQTQMRETMLMGLRLTKEGVPEARFSERFSSAIMSEFRREIDPLLKSGLLEWFDNDSLVLRLTPQGRLLANHVFRAFV